MKQDSQVQKSIFRKSKYRFTIHFFSKFLNPRNSKNYCFCCLLFCSLQQTYLVAQDDLNWCEALFIPLMRIFVDIVAEILMFFIIGASPTQRFCSYFIHELYYFLKTPLFPPNLNYSTHLAPGVSYMGLCTWCHYRWWDIVETMVRKLGKIVPVLEFHIKDVGNSTSGCKETITGSWRSEWSIQQCFIKISLCSWAHTILNFFPQTIVKPRIVFFE